MPVTQTGTSTILPFVVVKPPTIVMRTIPRKDPDLASRKDPDSDIFVSSFSKLLPFSKLPVASYSATPGWLFKVHDGQVEYAYGYRHCMYVLNNVLDPYTPAEIRQLQDFVLAQDRLRSLRNKGVIRFETIVARIAKTGLRSPERKAGRKWRYTTGDDVDNIRIHYFGSLKLLLAALRTLP